MVTMEKVQAGLVHFIDRDVAPGLSGWDRVLVAGGSGLFVANLPNIISQYADHPVVTAMGIYDKKNNLVNIDALYQAATPYMGTEALPVKIPVLGITVKIGKPEIDTLYKYIKEA